MSPEKKFAKRKSPNMRKFLTEIEMGNRIKNLILRNEVDFQFLFLELKSKIQEKGRIVFEELINTPLPDGQTLLYIACGEGKLEVVQFLHEQGLNPLIKSQVEGKQLECCLSLCARRGYSELVEYFLDTCDYSQNYIKNILFSHDLPKNCRKILSDKVGMRSNKRCACF